MLWRFIVWVLRCLHWLYFASLSGKNSGQWHLLLLLPLVSPCAFCPLVLVPRRSQGVEVSVVFPRSVEVSDRPTAASSGGGISSVSMICWGFSFYCNNHQLMIDKIKQNSATLDSLTHAS